MSNFRREISKITRDRLGRFASFETLRRCEVGDPCELGDFAEGWRDALRNYDEFLRELHVYLISDPDEARAIAEVIRDTRAGLREMWRDLEREQERIDTARLRAAYDEEDEDPRNRHAFLESQELDAMDLTGLEGREASTLALRLRAWNPKAKKVYVWRSGRRYLSPSVVRVDLNDPIIRDQPFADDLWELVRDRQLEVTYEDIALPPL